ncbi:trypsin-like peptidase domain-containing protein [Streptomyces sp. NPDC086023]|uniref:trypsin-like peptidase domain-containing protein n=1 Tax=Streptomyces sp. NPDC086023 TaxID=3365746 RepID=UPI0037D0758F
MTVALRTSATGAQAVGTGFFVGPGLVLTCAHVVRPGGRPAETVKGTWHLDGRAHELSFAVADMDVRPFDRPEHEGGPGSGEDLALIRVAGGAPLRQTCPALSRSPALPREGVRLYAYGHPGHDYARGDSYALRVVGQSLHRGGARLLKVAGSQVWPGASGSPVIDEATGCVVGVLRARQQRTSPTADDEARLIPVQAVRKAFPELAEAQWAGYPPLRDWLALLSDEQLRTAEWGEAAGARRRDYLRLLHDAAGENPYVEALYTALRGRPAGAAAFVADLRVPVRAKPGHGSEGPGSGCRPLDTAALLGGAHVVGDAGTGKTTLLRTVARDAAGAWLGGTVCEYVPVYAAAPVMADRIAHSAWAPYSWLSYAVDQGLIGASARNAADVRAGSATPAPDELENPPYPARKWLVLVDGMDEVDPRRRAQVENAVLTFANSPHCTVVVTSRDGDWVRSLDGAGLAGMRLCGLTDEVRRELAAKALAAFGADAGPAEVTALLDRLEQVGLAELAMRPMLCVALCALYLSDGVAGLTGGRFTLFERLTGHLLAGAGRRGGDAAAFPERELRSVLEEYAGVLTEPPPGPRPTLDELIARMPSKEPLPGGAGWNGSVRSHLHGAGLLASAEPGGSGRHAFSHALFADYFAACRWVRDRTPDERAVRQVAEDCMKRDRESYALFRAARLIAAEPALVDAELRSWRPLRRRQAAVLVAKLALDGAPVGPGLLDTAVAVLERWGRRSGPGPAPVSPGRPTDAAWPRWAAAQAAALRARGLPGSGRLPLITR